MQIIREIRTIHSDKIEIFVPKEFREKEVEILVLPMVNPGEKLQPKKKLQLTSYKCYGKKENFSRNDAYGSRI